MGNYYFLVSLLPELEIGHLPALNFQQFRSLIRINLSKEDQEKVKKFLRRIDFENFRAFWAKEPIDPRGNLNYEEIEASLLSGSWPGDEPFPQFLLDYLEKYHTDADRVKHFPLLLSQFYQYQAEHEEGFLAEYSAFQREMQLVQIGFRAKLLGKDIVQELQHEDSNDPIVAQIIAQRDVKEFEPPFEYKELKPIFEEFQLFPLELHRALYAYQFSQIVGQWGGSLFSVERILNYLARLLLVEKWLEMDVQKGIKIVDSIEGNVR
jgi:hypothetical protein